MIVFLWMIVADDELTSGRPMQRLSRLKDIPRRMGQSFSVNKSPHDQSGSKAYDPSSCLEHINRSKTMALSGICRLLRSSEWTLRLTSSAFHTSIRPPSSPACWIQNAAGASYCRHSFSIADHGRCISRTQIFC